MIQIEGKIFKTTDIRDLVQVIWRKYILRKNHGSTDDFYHNW